MKKILLIALVVLLLIGIPVSWYLISPLFITIEADESSPLAAQTTTAQVAIDSPDNLLDMDEETKAEFNAQVEEMAKEEKVMEDTMPTSPQLIAEGEFKRRSYDVEGKALLIDTPDGKILRFEDFFTVNGPKLHIYLSKDLSSSDYKDLGEIKATKGNVNYDIPADIDTEEYNKVLVWCEPFGVLFSYADLSQ